MVRRRFAVSVVVVVCALAGGRVARAAAPAFVPVQGYLTDASGQPVDGSADLVISIYASLTGGTPLYTETDTVQVDHGSFSLYLGQTGAASLDLAMFRDHPALYVGVAVNGGAELSPRFQLGTTPYAGYAEYAGTVDWSGITGIPSTVGQPDPIGGLSCASGQVAKWNGSLWVCAADDTLSETTVDTYVEKLGYARASTLATVATSGSYTDLTHRPQTLGDLSCASGQVAKWNGTFWSCAADADTNTTYTAGAGLKLTGTTFSLAPPLPASDIQGTAAVLNSSSTQTFTGGVAAATVSSTGSVTTGGDYTYATPKSHTIALSACGSFVPEYTHDVNGWACDGALRRNLSSSTATSTIYDYLIAPVTGLPDGATLTSVRCYYDTDGTGLTSAYARLYTKDPSQAGSETMVGTGTALSPPATPSGTNSALPVTLTQATVNGSLAYVLEIYWQPSAAGAYAYFDGCVVKYTATKVQP